MSHRYPQKPAERVRQLEVNALTKARRILERRGYTLQDLLPDGERHD